MDFNTSSFFSFDHHSFIPPVTNGGDFSVLDGNMGYGYTNWSHHQMDSVSPKVIIKTHNCFETTNSFGLASNSACKPVTTNGNGDWLYSDSTIVSTGSGHESTSPKPAGNKRPCTGENTQALKKPSNGTNGKAKAKATVSPKDPQSLTAKVFFFFFIKNRRERISERLKVLQELVPNGTKVDLVTMLEKAVGYVKFLQLQVKVLAADEFWPAQGGKAPDISQVKEAIDAILSSSQRDRNSN